VARASTPLMQQYLGIKAEHPDEILLFRLGDFYETFFEDARVTARALEIALTSRNAGDGEEAVPLAGFPAHAAEAYISRLLRAGYRVAVCEQVEDPKKAQGLVRREVVEVLSTGTALNEGYLDGERNNYLMVIAPPPEGEPGPLGLAVADISTGELTVTEVSAAALPDELQRFDPAEIIIPEAFDLGELPGLAGRADPTLTRLEGYRFHTDLAVQTLLDHFGVTTLKGYGLETLSRGTAALGALIEYLRSSRVSCTHLKRVQIRAGDAGMLLDAATQRNLELVANLRDGGTAGTLLGVLDQTATPMGARALRRALLRPLTDRKTINARHDAVQALLSEDDLRSRLAEMLDGLGDLERSAVRIGAGKGSPRDLASLRGALERLPELGELLAAFDTPLFDELGSQLDPLPELTSELKQALVDDPPLALTEGGIVRDGFHDALDRLRSLTSSGKGWIAELQQTERDRTGIPTLKIGFNKVFGYYLEVTKTHLEKVPDDYIRKQTLVAAERYITPELKEKEEEVLTAEERARELEYELFVALRDACAQHLETLQRNAGALALTDLLLSFASSARSRAFVRPELTEDGTLTIEAGRHPVVEALLPAGTFIPNDTLLSTERQIAIVTGPNMSGKSTYLRQVGLICLMAQAGAWVPAESARVPVLDRIFTRVGAMDNLAGGESTFLVEMHETANILHNATPDSLVLLDEVGRGTSTYDGLSIAWAVAEHLHDEIGARTVFATHYHELVELAERFPRIFNLNVAVREWGDKVIFLHTIEPGGCDHSYGIHVAELAGVPEAVIDRARGILHTLERERPLPTGSGPPPEPPAQIELFTRRPDPLVEALHEIDPEAVTPIEALNLLQRLKELIE